MYNPYDAMQGIERLHAAYLVASEEMQTRRLPLVLEHAKEACANGFARKVVEKYAMTHPDLHSRDSRSVVIELDVCVLPRSEMVRLLSEAYNKGVTDGQQFFKPVFFDEPKSKKAKS